MFGNLPVTILVLTELTGSLCRAGDLGPPLGWREVGSKFTIVVCIAWTAVH
jgi:hypothetical protein